MTGMLRLSDWEFKSTMINILMTPMDKIDNIKQTIRTEDMGNVNREMEVLRKNQKEMFETFLKM